MIKKLLQWGGAGILGVALLAYAWLWIGSERIFNETHALPASDFVATGTPEAIAQGEALTRAIGCHGCHADGMVGQVLFEEPFVARVIAPSVRTAAETYSDADFDRAIRWGIRPDGKGLIAMPSPALRHLSDEDLDAIVSYIRSLDTGVIPDLPKNRYGPLARFGMMMGEFETAAVGAAEGSDAQAQIEAQLAMATTEEERRGAYISMIVCSDCHGFDLAGGEGPDGLATDLRMVLAYSDSAFMALMREGRAHDGRDIGMMGEVYERMGGFTDDDIRAIRAYAMARAAGLAGGTSSIESEVDPR